jgi:adenylosuccinate lyase
LDECGVYPAVIERELRRYLPFLATTKVLMAAVRAGVGREQAHEVIKEHAGSVALAMREQGTEGNDLLDQLAGDSRLGLKMSQLQELFGRPLEFVGAAQAQTQDFVRQVEAIAQRHPEAAKYRPDPML